MSLLHRHTHHAHHTHTHHKPDKHTHHTPDTHTTHTQTTHTPHTTHTYHTHTHTHPTHTHIHTVGVTYTNPVYILLAQLWTWLNVNKPKCLFVYKIPTRCIFLPYSMLIIFPLHISNTVTTLHSSNQYITMHGPQNGNKTLKRFCQIPHICTAATKCCVKLKDFLFVLVLF